MITGRACKLTVNGQTVEAQTLIASGNLKSLILTFDAGIWVDGGGMNAGQIALMFDEHTFTYRDLMTGTPCEVDWLCAKCNEHFRGAEIFELRGEMGLYVWDVEAARALVADPKRVNPSPSGAPEIVPPEILARFLEVNEEITPQHLDHVDPNEPGIVAQRFGGLFLLDGTHRAHRCKRDGLPFRAYVMTLEESERVLRRDMTENADVTPEVVARELRGVLKNNEHACDGVDAVLESDTGDDTRAAEAEIRKHLTAEENAKIRIQFKPRTHAPNGK